jgi:GST-like protein
MIDLHYWPTPNGKKVTILLEELGMPYKIIPCAIGRGDQFKDTFLSIGPNNRMPAMVDHAPKGGGAPISVFESGAIMMYLAEKAGKFYGKDLRSRYEVTQWVIWQMANQGPKTGEYGHFHRLDASKGDQTYAKARFADEVNRMYGVMNNRLFDRRYLAGDEYSIADIAAWPWYGGLAKGQIYGAGEFLQVQNYKHVQRWTDAIAARPAVQRGRMVNRPFGEPASQLHERHDAADFLTNTQDKLQAQR